VARALAAAIAVSLLAVSGAGGAGAQTPKRGGVLDVVGAIEPPCLSVLVSPCKDAVLPIYGVLEGAFKLGPDYSWRPRLVSRVDVTTKPPFTLSICPVIWRAASDARKTTALAMSSVSPMRRNA